MSFKQSITELIRKAASSKNIQFLKDFGECLDILCCADENPSGAVDEISAIIKRQTTPELREKLRSYMIEACVIFTSGVIAGEIYSSTN
jgi:hypothetical protein